MLNCSYYQNAVLKVILVIIFVICVSSAHAGGITVLAPTQGVTVTSKDIIIIGKAAKGVKEIEIKGIAGNTVKATVKNGGFFSKVTLKGDNNKLSLSADDGSTFEQNINVSAAGGFNYHPDIGEVMDCSATCHGNVDSDGYTVNPSAPVCFECHDPNDQKEFVHGPVNMGTCGVCHLPHGSSNASFLVVNKDKLCEVCHETLMPKHPGITNKSCMDCHDPHSSDKEFHIK